MHATASVAHGTYESSRSASPQWNGPPSAQEVDLLEYGDEPGGNILKGAFFALSIEAAMVFMAVVIWHLIR